MASDPLRVKCVIQLWPYSLPFLGIRRIALLPVSVCDVISLRPFRHPAPAFKQCAFHSGYYESFLIRKFKQATIFGSEALIHIGPFSCSPVAANALPRRS